MAENDVQETVRDAGEIASSNGKGPSALMSKQILLPAGAAALTAAAAGLAVAKGPDLMKKLSGTAEAQTEQLAKKGAESMANGVKDALAGGKAGIAGKAAAKLMGGGGGGRGQGGKTRRLPIQRWTDVALPIEKVYEKWTNYEEFPKFMHRVLEVKQEEEGKLNWQEKIWFSSRSWEGEIVDERKNDRIAWKTTSGTQHSGLVSFHKLAPNLTRVLVTVDFVPNGMIEKMASGMRFAKRAVQADLARFKAYAELGEAKELEYSSKPEEMEQHREGGDSGEEEKDAESAESASAESTSAESADTDDSEREAKQQERESRRKERQDALSSS
jgi:uncharacterized membrane protein